jgi:hypothetical protein
VQGTSAYSFLKLNQAQAGVNLAAVAWYELKEAEGETPLTLTFVTLDGSCFQVHDDEARTLFTQLQSLSLPDNQKRQEALKNVASFPDCLGSTDDNAARWACVATSFMLAHSKAYQYWAAYLPEIRFFRREVGFTVGLC